MGMFDCITTDSLGIREIRLEGRVALNSGIESAILARLGVKPDQVIQEFGYDDDVDDTIRQAFEEVTDTDLEDEDYDDVTDGAILWWRREDGDAQDLADLTIDAMGTLEDGGLVWVLTPRSGRDGHVPPADVQEAAQILGKNATSSVPLGDDWVAFVLTSRHRAK